MYYPEQRYVSPLIVIRRRCSLPDKAIGTVNVSEGERVDVRDVIAHGVITTHYYILDGAKFFKLRNPDQLDDLLFVDVGDVVKEEDVLAGKKAKKGKRLFSPVRGIVAAIDKGRVILQAMPEMIDLEAGIRGRVVSIQPGSGVEVEATGAQVQGVWGNDRTVIATLQTEPEDGMESLSGDSLDMRFASAIILSRQPITADKLKIMKDKNLSGIIAPSMDSSLLDIALEANGAILLTEGFGNIGMSSAIYNILANFEGHQVTVAADKLDRQGLNSPEVIVNTQPKDEQRPARPNVMLALRPGTEVRITRTPYTGLTGTVIDLPKVPVLMENGLRIKCAKVELVVGETIFVPLANIEVLGR
jgi:hypothetical protein